LMVPGPSGRSQISFTAPGVSRGVSIGEMAREGMGMGGEEADLGGWFWRWRWWTEEP
jgi:hypothetical protein